MKGGAGGIFLSGISGYSMRQVCGCCASRQSMKGKQRSIKELNIAPLPLGIQIPSTKLLSPFHGLNLFSSNSIFQQASG